MQFATCCRPIPGDAIVGYLGRGEGLVVHTADCGVGKRLLSATASAGCGSSGPRSRRARSRPACRCSCTNGKGVLAQVASAVSHAEADITHIDMGDEPRRRDHRAALLLSVRDRLHLADVMRTLKRSPSVLRVARIKP